MCVRVMENDRARIHLYTIHSPLTNGTNRLNKPDRSQFTNAVNSTRTNSSSLSRN